MIERTVDVAGVPVRFESSDRERQRAVDAALAGLRPADGRAVFTVGFGPEARLQPERPWDHVDGDVRAWWEGDDLLILAHRELSARVTSDAAVIGGGGNLARGFRQLLPYVLTHLLAGTERFLVHAGAIECDGRALVVLGGSGSGKSSLVAGARRAGWRALGDDLAVLTGGDDPRVRAIGKLIAVPPDVVAACGFAGRPLDGDPRGRWVMPADADTGWYPVSGAVLSAHGDDPAPSLEPLPSDELVRWLLFSFLASRQPTRLRQFLPVAAAVTRRRGWTFRHGRPPAASVAAMGPVLDGLRSARVERGVDEGVDREVDRGVV